MNLSTPSPNTAQAKCSPVLERSLLVNKNRRDLRNCLLWGSVNFGVLLILLYDLSQTCPLYLNYYHYIEYTFIVILSINVFYYIVKFIKCYYVTSSEQIPITVEQKRLLGVKDSDPNYKIITPNKNITSVSESTPVSYLQSTPMNVTALSWRSNISPNDSMNYSLSSPSWSYHKGTPDLSRSQFLNRSSPAYSKQSTPVQRRYNDTSFMEFITDEDSLNKYLHEHEESEKISKMANKSPHSSNLLSSFWSHPITKTAADMSSFLKKCQYQLSTQSPSSPGGKTEDKSVSQISAFEVWTRINVDTVALTQWNENLRMWISLTVLDRLVKEFNQINESLEKHGMTDIRIGSIGLDRLRKTAQMSQITQFLPSLSTVIPFLELHANQQYLEKRVRELARGGCMSEFKWNGGGSYNGKEWDDSLPTDCAIVMHLLSTYLDTQLMPSPNMPDTKAFSGHYYIRATDKMPSLTSNSIFIQEVSEKLPHYRVVVGDKVYEMVKGYNNLFHSILFFIYQVNKMEQGMLGRVNLGKAGLNLLWVIGIDN